MGDGPMGVDLAHGVPPIAVSSTSTRDNRTGSWKEIRPFFHDQVAPCNQACPVGIDIEAAMKLAGEGRIREAAELFLRENPLPATTGRVCYHPCERACNRATFDQAVAVHAVERMLGDALLEASPSWPARGAGAGRVAVIGAGPAGLACAWHLVRLGHQVTVFEAEAEPGGILRYGIPEYRLPKAVLRREIERIAAAGVTFRCGARVGADMPLAELDSFDAVFVGTGASRSRSLGIEGEDLSGVLPGLRFLREVNRGTPPRIGPRVAVIGGGNTAIDCARTAVRLGAEVVVLYRRGREEMPAHAEEVEHALCEGVRLEVLAAPAAFLRRTAGRNGATLDDVEASFGEQEGGLANTVGGVLCRRMRLEAPEGSGRRRPVPVEGSEFVLEADTVLLALGEEADLEFAPGLLDRAAGVVRVGVTGATTRAAVFAGGDLLDEPHTVAYALGSGKRAAIGIDHFLRRMGAGIEAEPDVAALRLGPSGNLSATRWRGDDPVQRAAPLNEVAGPEAVHTQHFRHVPRHLDRMRPAESSRRDFREAVRGLTLSEALAEADRCFHCGVCDGCEVCVVFCPDVAISKLPDGTLAIDDDHCKGCGICAAECPRGAIRMAREAS